MTAADPTLGGLLGPRPPAPDVDPPGTCHLVGCPGKGTRDHHALGTTIGAPSDEVWAATSQPRPTDPAVIVERRMLTRALQLVEMWDEPVHLPVRQDEARIVGGYLRGLLEPGR